MADICLQGIVFDRSRIAAVLPVADLIQNREQPAAGLQKDILQLFRLVGETGDLVNLYS